MKLTCKFKKSVSDDLAEYVEMWVNMLRDPGPHVKPECIDNLCYPLGRVVFASDKSECVADLLPYTFNKSKNEIEFQIGGMRKCIHTSQPNVHGLDGLIIDDTYDYSTLFMTILNEPLHSCKHNVNTTLKQLFTDGLSYILCEEHTWKYSYGARVINGTLLLEPKLNAFF